MLLHDKGVAAAKACLLSAALISGAGRPVQAEELTLGASATLTTDDVFRGISPTAQRPADAYSG